VEVGGDVAGGSRIRVVVPDAADPLATLEHGHVVVSRAVQHHHRADAPEAAADDGDRGRPPSAAVPSAAPWPRAHAAETTPRRRPSGRSGGYPTSEYAGSPQPE